MRSGVRRASSVQEVDDVLERGHYLDIDLSEWQRLRLPHGALGVEVLPVGRLLTIFRRHWESAQASRFRLRSPVPASSWNASSFYTRLAEPCRGRLHQIYMVSPLACQRSLPTLALSASPTHAATATASGGVAMTGRPGAIERGARVIGLYYFNDPP